MQNLHVLSNFNTRWLSCQFQYETKKETWVIFNPVLFITTYLGEIMRLEEISAFDTLVICLVLSEPQRRFPQNTAFFENLFTDTISSIKSPHYQFCYKEIKKDFK